MRLATPIALAVFFALACSDSRGGPGGEENGPLEGLSLPPGFSISVYAEGLEGPRFMAFDPNGNLYVTLTKKGTVVALPDKNRDGRADKTVTAASGLSLPHGIAFYEGRAYVAETGRVSRFMQDPETLAFLDREVVVPVLPTRGGGHFTRTVAFGPDGKMYVSVGSSCNVCVEEKRERASVLRFNPDGSGKEIFAEGLRNSVGLAFHPESGELFATENGRDWLGDDLPPDEINALKKGGHYGWPYCYGHGVVDPKFNNKGFCPGTVPPVVEIQAHSAPLGLAFYSAEKFPARYRGGLFVALHGSWNRTLPTGYKIIYVPFSGAGPAGAYEDFVTGWLRGGSYWGRPAGIIETPGGDILISDDFAGTIYRVTYQGK